MQFASTLLKNNLFLAPMAGITDRPFRTLCKKLGASYAVSEMISSKPELRGSQKSILRRNHVGEEGVIAVQIAGTSAEEMAEAALYNIDQGAQVIDINMGCPVRKVCQKWAGSALMQDEALALSIIEAVVKACTPHNIPVTLKIRTGWDQEHKNAPQIAIAAEQAGITMLTIHGRTREQKYQGEAEYEIIASIKQQLSIPIIANGDIDTPEKAKFVLKHTKADALMIGRAAQSKPWIFKEIDHFLIKGEHLPSPSVQEVSGWMNHYLLEHYEFYGEFVGVRQARKHLGWLIEDLPNAAPARQKINHSESATEQLNHFNNYLDQLEQTSPNWLK